MPLPQTSRKKSVFGKCPMKKKTTKDRKKSFGMHKLLYLQNTYAEFRINRLKTEGVITLRKGFENLCENLREKPAQKSARKNFPPTVSDK